MGSTTLGSLLGYDHLDILAESMRPIVEVMDENRKAEVRAFFHCQYCGGQIQVAFEDEYLWFHDGGFGINTDDVFFMLLIKEIHKAYPEWKLRGACKRCFDELTFLEKHECEVQ